MLGIERGYYLHCAESAFSARVLGTISKISANFAMAYWSNLYNY
jgi:hypothetical protein